MLSQPAGDDQEKYVLIISIDGFPADLLWDRRVAAPTLQKLATKGVWAHTMIPSSPSVTWPNHLTMVIGVHADKHGLITNCRYFRQGSAGRINLRYGT